MHKSKGAPNRGFSGADRAGKDNEFVLRVFAGALGEENADRAHQEGFRDLVVAVLMVGKNEQALHEVVAKIKERATSPFYPVFIMNSYALESTSVEDVASTTSVVHGPSSAYANRKLNVFNKKLVSHRAFSVNQRQDSFGVPILLKA